jgi:hypothetical protein
MWYVFRRASVKLARLIVLIFLCSVLRAFCQGIDSYSQSDGPLIVDENSHIVVTEYEAWFGPNAVTFQSSAAMPLLQSADMQSLGGGYDSSDPSVIKQHVAWMESLGIDAVIGDLTNNVSCIFDSEQFVEKYIPNCTPSFRAYNQNIRDNTAICFPRGPAWARRSS